MHDSRHFHVYLIMSDPDSKSGWVKLSYGTVMDLITGRRLFEHRPDCNLDVELKNNKIAFRLATTKAHLRERSSEIDRVAKTFAEQEYDLFRYNCRTAAFTMLVQGMGFDEQRMRKLFWKHGIKGGIPSGPVKDQPLGSPLAFRSSLQAIVNEPLTIALWGLDYIASVPFIPNVDENSPE
jgi:hypothetical protein